MENLNKRYDLHIDLPNGDHLIVEIDLDNPNVDNVLRGCIASENPNNRITFKREDMRIYHESEFSNQ